MIQYSVNKHFPGLVPLIEKTISDSIHRPSVGDIGMSKLRYFALKHITSIMGNVFVQCLSAKQWQEYTGFLLHFSLSITFDRVGLILNLPKFKCSKFITFGMGSAVSC